MTTSDGDLSLTIGSTTWGGWTSIRVEVSIEECPNRFDIALTEVTPEATAALVAKPGDACTVKIGGDAVITGYVDDYEPSFEAKSHAVRITGRGKCQDLVDCSAEWPGGQIGAATAVDIATKLAKPYGITVKASGDPGPVIPQFNLSLGETAWEIISRCCRFAALLCFEDFEGNLVLAPAGTDSHASGFQQGVNVQAGRAPQSMAQRYSEYDAYRLALGGTFDDLGDGGNLMGNAKDPGVPRHRLKYIIAEAGAVGADITLKRAQWEAARRSGRGQAAVVTADSWRDSGGKLWTPNRQARFQLPALKLPDAQLLIGKVAFKLDPQAGKTAEISAMPRTAYLPEPVLLQPQVPDFTPGAGA